MASLFPFFGDTAMETAAADSLPLYREVAWDFENNIPILEKGDFKIVEGNEAIKTWAFKAMMTERFRYEIYSWNYGSELDSLIGQSYSPNLTKAECIRYIKETLLVNPYIRNVSNVAVSFDKGKLTVDAKINSIYGETEVRASV